MMMCLIITHRGIAAARCGVVPDFAQAWAPIGARQLGCLLLLLVSAE